MTSELSPEELRTLRTFFLDEAAEHLEEIDRAAAQLEGEPTDGTAISALLRRLHTLKGSAGSVELDDLAREAHVVEDQVLAIRGAGRPPDGDELRRLWEAIEEIRRRVAQVVRLVHPPEEPRPSPSAIVAIARRERSEVTQPRGEAMQIRVEVKQVDELMDAVGELVLDRTRIARRLAQLEGCVRDVASAAATLKTAIAEADEAARAARLVEMENELDTALADLERAATGMGDDTDHLRHTSQVLKEGIERVRMMEVGRLFARLAGPVREMARRSGRGVELVMVGERTAVDKAVVERIADPMLHLLRNAIAHGIEPREARVAAGKPEAGRVELSARQRGDQILIAVADDGGGIDVGALRGALVRAGRAEAEVAALSDGDMLASIFHAKVSTRDAADDLAGRGLGLDAVKEAIERLGGVITVETTPGAGTRFTVQLPLTTAITKALLFKVGGHVYAVPSSQVLESDVISASDVRLSASGDYATVRGRELPLVRLGALLGEPPPPGKSTRRSVVVCEHESTAFAMTCDKLVGPREIVVKGLGPLLAPLSLFAGATVSGAGKVQLILDVARLASLAGRTAPLGPRPTGTVGGARVLIADDSRSLRETAALLLLQGGYRVETVPDGWEAWELLQDRVFDLLITDGEMPRLDGYELCQRVRRVPALRSMPVLVMTSRMAEAMRAKAMQAGADGFLAKPLRKKMLLDAVTAALAVSR